MANDVNKDHGDRGDNGWNTISMAVWIVPNSPNAKQPIKNDRSIFDSPSKVQLMEKKQENISLTK
jgi:hypothetical protein